MKNFYKTLTAIILITLSHSVWSITYDEATGGGSKKSSEKLNYLIIGAGSFSATLDDTLIEYSALGNSGTVKPESFSSLGFSLGYGRKINDKFRFEFIFSSFSVKNNLGSGSCNVSCDVLLKNAVSVFEINGVYVNKINNKFDLFLGLGIVANNFTQTLVGEATVSGYSDLEFDEKKGSSTGIGFQFGADFNINSTNRINFAYKVLGDAGKALSTATGISGFSVNYVHAF